MASSSSAEKQEEKSQGSDQNRNEDHADEIAFIKRAFAGRCRIIIDNGDYKYIITVQPKNYDMTIKFQLRATYPSVIPDIVVRSSSLTTQQNTDLRNSLITRSKELVGEPMIQPLMQLVKEKLPGCGLKPGKVGSIETHTIISDKAQEKKKKRKTKCKPKSEDEVEEEKKKPMKTADDVIKRILWDESLEKDDFLVGYIDRFRGLLEKYFSAFSWEDLASVDYDVLAVPQHRIQYFKYKTVKVWDKPHRIDNVFGSARGTKTIDVVVKEVEELEQRKKAEKENAEERASMTEDSDDDSDYSDSDDDITVTIGASASIGIKSDETSAAAIDDDDPKKNDSYNPYWRDKLRPNYFICVRITDPNILDHTAEVQDHLMDEEPLFGECCIPGASLHVTLCTVGLDTPEQLVNCMNALKKMKDELKSVLPKSLLKLHGVSHFYSRVVYAKVVYGDEFINFCDALKLNLRAAGIDIRDGYEFVPHMTIIKTTRPVSKMRGTKNIDASMYEQFLNKRFGEQKMESISLCSMSTERQEDGFYMTPLEITFG